jgi:hypothetical protein
VHVAEVIESRNIVEEGDPDAGADVEVQVLQELGDVQPFQSEVAEQGADTVRGKVLG